MKSFPQPIKLSSNMTRWRLSDLESHEAALCGEPEPPRRPPESERYLTAKQVADRYGMSTVSVWRWSAEARKAEASA